MRVSLGVCKLSIPVTITTTSLPQIFAILRDQEDEYDREASPTFYHKMTTGQGEYKKIVFHRMYLNQILSQIRHT